MNQKIGINCFQLKIVAVICMLCDHIGFALYPDVILLRVIGRLAFPIFAFLVAEGMHATKNPKKYCVRMLLFAVIAEVPYDLFKYGKLNAEGQNVLWTFFIAMIMMYWMRMSKSEDSKSFMAAVVGGILFGGLIATYIYPDYSIWGVELMFLFYLCHGWKHAWIGEVFGMFLFNFYLIGGSTISLGTVSISVQYFGIFALIPIFFYNGKHGYYNKVIQYAFYVFYPAHMLILYFCAR